VIHTYKSQGTYTLTLKVTAPNGTRRVSKTIQVSNQLITYVNPYVKYQSNGIPPSNPRVHLPALISQPVTPSRSANGSPVTLTIVLIAIGIAVLLALLIVSVAVWRSRRPAL
jgi:PKD repeat protein